MLNPFPSLLMYSFLAPTLIRITVGGILFYLAVSHFRNRVEIARLMSPFTGKFSKLTGGFLAVIEMVTGILLIVGLNTQIAALVGGVLAIKSLLLRRKLHALVPLSHTTYLLILVMCLSLLATGAGAWAFDLPL